MSTVKKPLVMFPYAGSLMLLYGVAFVVGLVVSLSFCGITGLSLALWWLLILIAASFVLGAWLTHRIFMRNQQRIMDASEYRRYFWTVMGFRMVTSFLCWLFIQLMLSVPQVQLRIAMMAQGNPALAEALRMLGISLLLLTIAFWIIEGLSIWGQRLFVNYKAKKSLKAS